MNDFIVLGGGTAGCISALMLKKAYPKKNIKIIESKKIGIIGVGEGSTEHWKSFCNYIGITQYDLIKNTGATFKLGEQMVDEPVASAPDPAIDKNKQNLDKQKISNIKMLQQKQQMLQRQRLQMQKSGKLPLDVN